MMIREWAPSMDVDTPSLPGFALFVGLNPSTADKDDDDPTTVREVQFTSDMGYCRYVKVNLFAYRATDPKTLRTVKDPIGPRTDTFISNLAARAKKVVCAWGAGGNYLGRNNAVRELIKNVDYYALSVTKDGEPGHPLYLPRNSPLIQQHTAVDRKAHIRYLCSCNETRCNLCEGGLFLCAACNGAEASLTTHCPRYKICEDFLDEVQAGKRDFVDGLWRYEGENI
jgi:hypothetical protein